MANFYFTGTVRSGVKSTENLWIFGYDSGGFESVPLTGPGDQWSSNQATNPQELDAVGDHALGAMALTVVVPVPLATQIFTPKAAFSGFQIFGTDKPDDPNWTYNYKFERATVINSKVLAKGSFKLPARIQADLLRKGSAAWLTPQAVLLALLPN